MKLQWRVLLKGLWLALLVLPMIWGASAAQAADNPAKGESIQMMEAFDKQTPRAEDSNVLQDHKKHVIMFVLGVPLLILILITAGLGIAMVVYGKQVYMFHMIFAGLSVTLAVAHLVTGLVWFYPF